MKFIFASVLAAAAISSNGMVSAETTIVDLSQPEFARSSAVNDNPGANEIIDLASSIPEVRTLLVLEHGQVVADLPRWVVTTLQLFG